MSLCDVCLSPGACCRRMVLSGRVEDGEIGPMSREKAEHMALRLGLPFFPAQQRADGNWEWSCTRLLPSGRCGDYENRPQLCRAYVAGSDGLCVHHWADPTGSSPRPRRRDAAGSSRS